MEIKHDKCNKRTNGLPTVLIHCVERGRGIVSSAEHDYFVFFLKKSPGTLPVRLTGLTFISQWEKVYDSSVNMSGSPR